MKNRIFEHLNAAIFVVDAPTQRIIEANAQAAELLGKTRDEIVGTFHTNLYPPKQVRKYRHILTVAASHSGGRREAEVVKKDGTIVPVIIFTSLAVIAGRKAIFGLFWDITLRKQIEVAHKESEERFRQLANASFEGILLHENGIVLDANETFAVTNGYRLDEVIGMDSMKFISPEYRDAVLKNVSLGYDRPYEVECLRKDGSSYRAEIRSKETHYQGRKVRVAAIRDVTRRKQMEDRLRESEEKLRTIFESITDAIIVCDRQGLILQVNDGALRLHGFSDKDSLVGRNISGFIAEEDLPRARRNIKKRFEGKQFGVAEYRCLRRDGTSFDTEVSVAIVRDKQEEPVNSIMVERDITERNRLRENMQFYISAITKAQEDERQRIARELHDETVQSLASLCLDIDRIMVHEKKNLPEAITQRLEQVRGKTRTIMEEARRFSHRLRPDILDRLGLIPALELVVGELGNRDSLNARLKVSGRERRLAAETELNLFRIAQEAIGNIRKHARASEAMIRVAFGPSEVVLTAEDNGRGFEVPEPLGALASDGKLGLCGMQERARLLGGTLTVESHYGKGTKITMKTVA